MSKLFLGNLPFRARESDLEQFLDLQGVTSFERAEVVRDRETGQSRGFGFVHFATDSEAEDALEKLDGVAMDGRTLKVDRATGRQVQHDQVRELGRAERRDGGRRRHRDEDAWR
jgi:RNA recognition motif-containing protein